MRRCWVCDEPTDKIHYNANGAQSCAECALIDKNIEVEQLKAVLRDVPSDQTNRTATVWCFAKKKYISHLAEWHSDNADLLARINEGK